MAPDFRLHGVLAPHGVPFVVIGGHAVNVHGYVRATEDTDVLWIQCASLGWLRRLKQAAARPKDLLDLENLPVPDPAD